MRGALGLVDGWLLLAVLTLALLGVMLTQSAVLTEFSLRPGGAAARQLVFLAGGLVAMVLAAAVDYRSLRRFSRPIYIAALIGLVIVLTAGIEQFGARRWVAVGPLTVQPSEFAKLAAVVAMAAYAAGREPGADAVVAALGLVLVPAALVALQPDTGTTLVIVATWFAITVAWGARWQLLGVLLVAGVALVPLTFALAVPDYQRERLAVFTDPGRDPLGSGFTLRLVEAAFDAGGLAGGGLFPGAASTLGDVSTRTSDFAFASVGEQLGLLGTAAVLALFLLLAWRGVHAAAVAPDRFGRLLAAGLTAALTVQAMMHVAVNLRLLPATGIPLPFVSQGGSALIVACIAAGLLQSIAAHRPPTPEEQWRAERWL
jgi:rod shape determining protein RodA